MEEEACLAHDGRLSQTNANVNKPPVQVLITLDSRYNIKLHCSQRGPSVNISQKLEFCPYNARIFAKKSLYFSKLSLG